MTGIRQKWAYTAAILVSMVFLAMAHQMRPSQLSAVIGYYGLSASQQGMPAAFATMGSICAMFLAIALTGRVRKPVMLVASIAASLLLMLPQYFCPPPAPFLALNFAYGIALGMIDTLVSACMAEVHTGKRSALMLSLLHASYGLGGITAPVLYGRLLASGTPWNRLFLVLILIGLALLMYIAPVSLGQARLTAASANDRAARFSISGARSFFADPILSAFTGLMFCFGMSFGGMTTWMVRFVDVTYSTTMGDTVLSLVFLGILVGRVVTPFMPVSEKAFLKIAGAGYFLLMSAALLIGSAEATAIFACLACILAGPIVPYAMSIACCRMLENTLLVSTILNLSMYIGQTLASPIMGGIESFAGLEVAMAFSHMFGLGCSIFAVAGLRSRKASAQA